METTSSPVPVPGGRADARGHTRAGGEYPIAAATRRTVTAANIWAPTTGETVPQDPPSRR